MPITEYTNWNICYGVSSIFDGIRCMNTTSKMWEIFVKLFEIIMVYSILAMAFMLDVVIILIKALFVGGFLIMKQLVVR